jgi:hypothetical protein
VDIAKSVRDSLAKLVVEGLHCILVFVYCIGGIHVVVVQELVTVGGHSIVADDDSTHVLVSFKNQVILMELFPCRRSKHPAEGLLLFSVL